MEGKLNDAIKSIQTSIDIIQMTVTHDLGQEIKDSKDKRKEMSLGHKLLLEEYEKLKTEF